MTALPTDPQLRARSAEGASEWLEITVAVPAESTEATIAALLDAGSPGVAELAGAPTHLVACLKPGTDTEEALRNINAALQRIASVGLARPVIVQHRFLHDADWANAWKQFYHPLRVGRRLVVKPPWEAYVARPDELVIELDPGMAFGTGSHPTTRLCLQALEDHVEPGDTVADIGTGSGILAMAAALLGAGIVYATDIDSLPRTVAQHNAEAMGLGDIVRVLDPDAFYRSAVDCRIVVANILAPTIIALLPNVAAMLQANGIFIASGIVADDLDKVINALTGRGFHALEIRREDVWRAIVAQLPKPPRPE